MPCLDCMEKRAAFLNAIGLGRFAPDLDKLRGGVAPVAQVNGTAAVSEIDATAHIREQFARYLAHSNGATAVTVVHAAVQLIAFTLGQACPDRACADEQIGEICETLRRSMTAKYDADTGKRREIVMAKALHL
jgi:hypothetical protein